VDPIKLSADGRWRWDGTAWVSNLSPDGYWRWNGAAWVPAATEERHGASWVWRFAVPALLPVLAFELVLLLAPYWAPDETYSLRGTIVTAPAYAMWVGWPGVVLGALTRRTSLLVVGTLVLVAVAAWAAIAMVASDDGQAGLAVFFVWYAAALLLPATALVEFLARRRARRAPVSG
jgi:hypothetical protein